MDNDIEYLERQLEIRRGNLHKLEERGALYGSLNVPLELQNQIELEKREIARLEGKFKLSESAQDTGPKRRVILYLQGDFSLLSSPERKSSMIDALAGLLRIPTGAIEVYRVHEGSTIFDLGIPSNALQRLRSLLQSNSEQLRLLKVEKVILERESGETEEWVIIEGKFDLVTTSGTASKQKDPIEPIRKLPALVRGGNRSSSLIEKISAVVAIVGLPMALFALIESVANQPVISLVVALITAILASVLVVRSGWTDIIEVIVAWLTLVVVVLAGLVIWPKTMTVEGIICDTAGNPVSSEEVLLFDRSGKRYETKTNAEGHYQFIDVPIGKYKVQVSSTEVEGGTEGFLVRKVQQNITVSETLVAASPTPTPTAPSTLTPTPTQTAGPTNTPTSTPTATPTSTLTPTPIPTPVPDAIIIAPVNLRSGPGTVYDIISTLSPGQVLTVTGRITDTTWLQVNTDQMQAGWVINRADLVTLNLPTEQIPIVSPPPPIPPVHVLSNFDDGTTQGWRAAADWPGSETSQSVMPSEQAGYPSGALWGNFDFESTQDDWPKATFYLTLPSGPEDWTSATKLRFDVQFLPDTAGDIKATTMISTVVTVQDQVKNCYFEDEEYKLVEQGKLGPLEFELKVSRYKNHCGNSGQYDESLKGANQVVELALVFIPNQDDGNPPPEERFAGAVLIDNVTLVGQP